MAIAGSIVLFFGAFVLVIASIVLTAVSKEEFEWRVQQSKRTIVKESLETGRYKLMAHGKYAKYIVEGKDRPVRAPERDGKIFTELVVGEDEFPESPNWVYASLIYEARTGYGFGDEIEMTLPNGKKNNWRTSPHVHPAAESFVFLGTDPYKPRDLGAEVEVWLGEEEEAEKYTITKSTYIFIPPNLVHCPVWVKRLYRPFIFLAILNDPRGSDEMGGLPLPKGFSKDL
jgi:hypothetical protein